ncbi:MAG: ATP-binding protein [Blautia sp.]|nr:ATP-binding protein [Blautia sp.]MCM1200629.1 ATP-binding protein [Bacteroides fragilis]
MYKALEESLCLLFYMAEGYCLFLFCDSFLKSRLNSRKWTGAAVIFFYAGIQEAENLITAPHYENADYESLRVICSTALLLFFLMLLAAGFYKGDCRTFIFVAITFLAVHETAYLFAYTVWQEGYHLLTSFALRYMERGRLSADGLIGILYAGGFGMLFLICATSALLLYGVLKNIIKNFHDKEYILHRKELFFLLAPGMAGLLFCVLLRIMMFIVDNEKTTLLYDRYPVLVVLAPLILFLSLLSILYGVKAFQDVISLSRERSGRVILENQISSMQKYIEEIEHIYAGIRSMKHDMQNTVSLLLAGESAGADAGKADAGLHDYLAEFQKAFARLEFRYRTGNAVVDTLLNMKYHEICHTMPELKLDAEKLLFPVQFHIQSYDMGVIFGNALDNALEACGRLHEQERETGLFIRLSSFRKGNMFFLEVENSFDGEVRREAQTGFPVTGKTNREAHGIGMVNIRNAVQKYHGAVDWSVNGRVFTLSVMMQNTAQKEREQIEK